MKFSAYTLEFTVNVEMQSSQVWSFPNSEILGVGGGRGDCGRVPQKTFEPCTSQIAGNAPIS